MAVFWQYAFVYPHPLYFRVKLGDGCSVLFGFLVMIDCIRLICVDYLKDGIVKLNLLLFKIRLVL